MGYIIRVSTLVQQVELQTDAVNAVGCEKIFIDKISGVKAQRPALNKLIEQLRHGDTVVVWRLDRLGRSTKDLILLVEEFKALGVGLQSLQENIDTNTSTGNLIFQIFGAIAEFERNLIRERTNAGLAAARARGRKGGTTTQVERKQNTNGSADV